MQIAERHQCGEFVCARFVVGSSLENLPRPRPKCVGRGLDSGEAEGVCESKEGAKRRAPREDTQNEVSAGPDDLKRDEH